ncbi:AMP-binding protein [Parabacteroides sp. OttesenSCG-928-G07]|nr:AMP-binding protein [Parabacteroides sp. OttesenSCG-928-G07]
MSVKTSGSTGASKTITVQKEQMRNSARMTCDFLNLKKGDTALLCMPLDFIAGKMMVVRALETGMRLIARTPSSHPLKEMDETIDFAAMTPMQVYNSLHNETEANRLKSIKVLIIGGGVIPQELEIKLRNFPNQIYSTYGMTETLSHIALRQLNGEGASAYYSPFTGIKLSLSDENTLCIDAPLLSDEPIYTNDMAELLPDGRFRIIGRKDNIINSGGIKIQAEVVEETLRKIINASFAITSVPHPQYGEAVVLLIEGVDSPDTPIIAASLPKYQQPKYIWNIDKIPLTETGKTAREACKKIACERIMSDEL